MPFFSISASEFIEAIGSRRQPGARPVRPGQEGSAVDHLRRRARRDRPARGGAFSVGGVDEREQTLNQILTEMDGFQGNEGVVVLAATNRPEILDPALLRPGRFDPRVNVSPPDRRRRLQILQVRTRRVPLAPDVDLAAVAASTPGVVGADLANLVNNESSDPPADRLIGVAGPIPLPRMPREA